MAEIWEQSIYGGGTDTGAGHGCVWRLGVGDEQWTAQRFEGPMVVEDISLDCRGRVHLVGAVPGSDPRESRAAYAVLEHGRMQIVDVGLGRRDTRRLRQGGGAERFRGIWAEQEPIIILSSCAWFLDDPSDYVILCEGGRGTLLRLERAFLGGAWRAPRGAVTVYAGNSIYRTWNAGRRWKRQRFLEALQEAWRFPVVDIHDVTVAELGEAVCVGSALGASGVASAVLVSDDHGRTYHVAIETEDTDEFFVRALFEPG